MIDDIKRMVYREGFASVLLRRYAEAAANGTPQTQRVIFDNMEEEFENEYKARFFWTFDAYRQFRYRHGLKPPEITRVCTCIDKQE